MRLTVLGGSAAGPNPGAGCSGYLVAQDGTNIVLDLGPGTLPELFNHATPPEIDAIVISHMHQDHWLDLIPFRYRLKYGPSPARRSIELHLPPGGKAVLDTVSMVFDEDGEPERFFTDVFVIKEYDPSSELKIKKMVLSMEPAVHPLPCWMMRVKNPAGDLGYTADTGENPRAVEFFSGVRCLIVEATRRTAGPSGAHLTAREAGRLATDCGALETVLCHMWAEHGFEHLLRDAREMYQGPLHAARPGLQIEWS